ncbi:MAG: DSD1 family PLP-dependent enzyme [Planctomycetales bacterium]|nr:DSD1 family PLP-dependent enzyme [Planctomycetales bacterium]
MPFNMPRPYDLETPCLALDLDRFDANVQSMVATCRRHGVAWRPHAKCHKSPIIARWLIDAGANGITCATVREVEMMADAGVRDLLLANMVAGALKLQRLARAARQSDVIVCIDHLEQAQQLAAVAESTDVTFRILIELEIGLRRVGVIPDDRVIRLAQQIRSTPRLEFSGLMAYEGHLLTIDDPGEKLRAIRAALGPVTELKHQLVAEGLPCPIVSCGGTGSYPITVQIPGITEVQAGGAIFMDAFYRDKCQISELQNALTVVSTVVSRPSPDRAVIDAGRKAMNIEIHPPQVLDWPGVTVAWLSAEHGVLHLTDESSSLSIGQQVRLVPGYADLTNILHSCFYGFRQGRLEQIIPIVRD